MTAVRTISMSVFICLFLGVMQSARSQTKESPLLDSKNLFEWSGKKKEALDLLAKTKPQEPLVTTVQKVKLSVENLDALIQALKELQANLQANKLEIIKKLNALQTENSAIEQLNQRIKELEEQLSSDGDDAQMQNIELQNQTRKLQQTLQMLQNISKVLYETAMNVLRNMDNR